MPACASAHRAARLVDKRLTVVDETCQGNVWILACVIISINYDDEIPRRAHFGWHVLAGGPLILDGIVVVVWLDRLCTLVLLWPLCIKSNVSNGE